MNIILPHANKHGRIVHSRFRPAPGLSNHHLQTLLPTLTRPRPRIKVERERILLPDGDFVDIDWIGRPTEPAVLILHGLEGSLRSPYAGTLLKKLAQANYFAGLLYHRGCSGEPNLLPQSYHAGLTSDLDHVVKILSPRFKKLACVGYSLGGNVLLKWLGEQGPKARLSAAVAVSVPFDLARGATSIQHGFNRLYQWYLLSNLKRSLRQKKTLLSAILHPYPRLSKLRTLEAFDNEVTAPVHGFANATEYYQRASSRPWLKHIQVPTLILQAKDDPLVPADGLPQPIDLSSFIRFELSEHGGHVGFIGRGPGGLPAYWLDMRILRYLNRKFRA